jgi:hypothetical protein
MSPPSTPQVRRPSRPTSSRKGKVVAHLSGDDGGNNPALAQCCRDKKARDRKHYGEEMVATVSNPQQQG